MKIIRVRSFIYDYILSDGRNAHKPYQIIMPNVPSVRNEGKENARIVNNIISSMPYVTPLSIVEILDVNMTMDKLSELGKRSNIPFELIYLNLKNIKKTSKKKRRRS